MLNALKGVEGFYCSKKQISSIAMFVSVESLLDRSLPFHNMDLVQEMHKVITQYTPVEEEEVAELYPMKYKFAEYFLTKYNCSPVVFDMEDISWPAKYAPVTIVTVPVLPRQAHTEAQVVAVSDKVHEFFRLSWTVQMENTSLVIAATYAKDNTVDITTYIMPTCDNLDAVFADVDMAVTDVVQQFTNSTYNYQENINYTPIDVLRARVCIDQRSNASVVLQAIQSINSPLSTAAIVGVYDMTLNHAVALREQALYKEYSKTPQQQVDGQCWFTYQLILTTGKGE